jgi:hypothetical protein
MSETIIEVDASTIIVTLDGTGGGTVQSNIKEEWTDDDDEFDNPGKTKYNAAVLAQACEGIDILSESYIDSLRTSLQAIGNQFDYDEWDGKEEA